MICKSCQAKDKEIFELKNGLMTSHLAKEITAEKAEEHKQEIQKIKERYDYELEQNYHGYETEIRLNKNKYDAEIEAKDKVISKLKEDNLENTMRWQNMWQKECKERAFFKDRWEVSKLWMSSILEGKCPLPDELKATIEVVTKENVEYEEHLQTNISEIARLHKEIAKLKKRLKDK